MTKEEKNQTSEEKKYFAFISYSHKDKDAAKKLQNFIQGYKIPAKLEDRPDLPKRIGRVFRDEDELAGDELTPQIEEALRQSRYLIVVCSPNSAKSKYVNEEIEYFKSLGGETKILPYIIAGKATTDEDPDCCYAPALRENQEKYQIVGGDAQENGAEAASVKLIAGMLRLEFNMLYDRFRKAEKRKRKIVITVSAAFVLLATIVALVIWNQNRVILDKNNELNKAYKDLQNEKDKVESEKKAKDEAYEELFATKDTLAIKNLALESTNRELNLKNLSLQESKSIILAENAMNKIEKGDYFGARRSALEAITLSYSPEAERALRQSWESNSGTLEGHSEDVWSVCWSPDGKYLASGSADYTLIIWDAKSGQRLKTLEGHSDRVNSVSFSPDGKYLASGSWDETVIIWDANSGEKLKILEGHSRSVESVSFSPDGKYLASGSSDKTVIIWDAKSGKELKTLEGHSNDVNSVSWSPDGKYLASGSQRWNGDILIGCIEIWDAKSGEIFKTLEGHSYGVESVCWSPDGKYLASGSDDETVIIWDAKSGEKLKTLEGHFWYVYSVSWSPDGKYLASGSIDKTLIIWDAKSGQSLKTLEGHSSYVSSVSWSPDGKYLASGSYDRTVVLWDLNEDKKYSKWKNMPPNVYSSELSPDGKYLASRAADGTVIIEDAKSGQSLKTLDGHFDLVLSESWSPDGKYLVSGSGDGTVKLWDAKSGLCLQTFEVHNVIFGFVGFTSDGRKIISKDTYGGILQWDFPPLDELIEKTKKWAGK